MANGCEADMRGYNAKVDAIPRKGMLDLRGDAEAARIYADAYNRDPEFYSFNRSLMAYKESFGSGADVLLLKPDSEFFRYLGDFKR